MSESTSMASSACPSCKQTIRGREFLSSPVAPLYMRCKHCKEKLRMKCVSSFYIALFWMLVGGLLMLFIGMLLSGLLAPKLHFLVRAGIGLALASLLAIYIAVQFPLQEYRLMKCGEKLAGQSSESGYRFLGFFGFLLFGAAMAFGGMWIIFNNDELVHRLATGAPRSYGKLDAKWTVYGLQSGLPKRMSRFKDKVLFINFWESWCKPCRDEMPSIHGLHEAFKNNPHIEFLIVSSQQNQVTRKMVAGLNWKLPFYFCLASTKPKVFESPSFPTTFFVDRRGDVVFKHVGVRDWNTEEIRDRLRELIQKE